MSNKWLIYIKNKEFDYEKDVGSGKLKITSQNNVKKYFDKSLKSN